MKIVDGTTVSMPDTFDKQQLYPQPSNRRRGCGFPVMKLVGLFSLATGPLLDFAKGNLLIHESMLFRRLWDLLMPGDILLGDRGFCSYFSICTTTDFAAHLSSDHGGRVILAVTARRPNFRPPS